MSFNALEYSEGVQAIPAMTRKKITGAATVSLAL